MPEPDLPRTARGPLAPLLVGDRVSGLVVLGAGVDYPALLRHRSARVLTVLCAMLF